MNVLLTCAGRRHYLATYFQNALSGNGKVIGTDMDLSAPALQACDVAHKVPGVFESNYLDVLKEVIISEKVDMVFSLNDLEIGLLTKNRDAIEQETDATLYVPTQETLDTCADKWQTYQFAKQIGVLTPETFLSVDETISALNEHTINFPLIVKPRWGSASIGLFIVNSVDELTTSYSACVQSVAKSSLSSLGTDESVIIQEVIEGPEFGVDLLYSKTEVFIGFTAKRKLIMRAGETDKAISVDPSLFENTVNKIASHLPHRGNLDCDFLERDGEYYLLEFNPRFGGGYPFTHLAGANHVQMLLDDYQNHTLEPYSYVVGKGFAKCDTLVEVPTN